MHPLMPDELTIPDKDGEDAPRYLEKEISRVLKKLEDMEEDEA